MVEDRRKSVVDVCVAAVARLQTLIGSDQSGDYPDWCPQRSRYLAALAVIALLIAGIFAWDARYEGDPDGISYANIAEQVVRGNVGALVNPYWSPLYPLLNAAILAIFHPQPEEVLPSMHFAGFVMFTMATFAFLYFIRQWLRLTASGDDDERRFLAITFFAWCIFLWVSLRLVGVVYPLPDMLTLACILVAAGLCCRIAVSGDAPWRYGLLGLVLGIGYTAKFSVAPMTALLFAAMLACSKKRIRTLKNVAVAGLVFLAVASPLIVATSRRVGHLSLGESGKLNYAWHVNATPFLWTGAGGFAQGEARVRVISRENPLVYEFADDSGSTVPVWYDPAYWHAGLQTHLDAGQLFRSFGRRLKELFRGIEDVVPLAAGFYVLASLRKRNHRGGLRRQQTAYGVRLFAFWGFLICCPFLLVHVEFRYIAGAIFLLSLAAYGALERRTERDTFNAVVRVVGLAMLTTLIPPGHRALLHAADALEGHHPLPEQVVVARGLHDLGIRPGDEIAVAGYALDAYYAQIAGIRVVAQVCDSTTYAQFDWHDPQPSCHAKELLRRDPQTEKDLWTLLRRSGCKAILTREVPSDSMPSGWRHLGETRFWVRLL